MASSLERMQELFPKCPICHSEEGYKLSTFYPNVQCMSCKAEWLLYEDGMELKGESEQIETRELLDHKRAFEFWKGLKLQPQEKEELIVAPMDYMGGHTEYRKPAVGYILLKPDSLSYIAGEGSLNKMNVHIPIEDFKAIEIQTTKEVTIARWFLIGAWSILFKEKKEYMVLTYEDKSKMLQHLIFDFHQQRRTVDELMNLVTYFKKKHTETNSA